MADKGIFERPFVRGLALAGVILLADQISKWWIVSIVQLPEKGAIEVSGIFDLTFVRNFGVSFGMLQAGSPLAKWGLMALSGAIATVFLLWMRSAERQLTVAALAMVIGGALGNMIDRLRFGYVVDFLDFSGLYFPWVFNVADAGISVGAALLVLDYFVNGEEKPPKITKGAQVGE